MAANNYILIALILLSTKAKLSFGLEIPGLGNVGQITIMCSLTCENICTTCQPPTTSKGIGGVYISLKSNRGSVNTVGLGRTDSNGTFKITITDSIPIPFNPSEFTLYSRLPLVGNCKAFGSTAPYIISSIYVIGIIQHHDGPEAIMTCTRLYTSIHAKPKPKFKSGAITESTTALNVDQTNGYVVNADQKSAAMLPLVAPSRAGNSQDQQSGAAAPLSESGTNCSTTSTAASSVLPHKKETGILSKVQADKKKVDARKKSLKRL
ncbi:hypothetical protein ACFE04_029324 [Oxalis oulophora]